MRVASVLTSVLVVAAIAPAGVLGQSSGGKTRTYYVAADEVAWDFLPAGSDEVHGRAVGDLYNARQADDRVGHVYKKAVYREYTDGTFMTLKPRPSEWEHLGILGPLLRAEVGDTIQVVFRNNGSHPYSMHPHGVIYDKASEGSPYGDGTSGADKADDGVPPGGTHTYVWPVPERAGPGPGEGSSIVWMYHSHVDETKDINAGLVGPMIVTARGMAGEDGSPKDVDREIVVMFKEFDENESWYLDANLDEYTAGKDKVDRGTGFLNPFQLSNFMETINGMGYGNLPGLTMRVGERVRWYVFSSTNFGDLHAPHWHGNVVVANHMRNDVVNIGPMQMLVADMVPDNPGVWLFHCHVREHNDFGMQALYTVLPAGAAAR